MSDKKTSEYVVVRYRPGRRWWRLAVLITCTVVAAGAGYSLGQAQGGFRSSDVLESRNSLFDAQQSLESQLTAAQQQLINLDRGRAIDAQALSQARRSITELETRVASLTADLTFYKNIMAPSEASKGLQVDRLTIKSSRKKGRYAFKLVLTQVGGNKKYIAGVVAVNVIGQRNGKKEIIALRDLSPDVEDLGVKFKYRYFQDIEGHLSLPEGFEPIEVQVVAQSQGRKPAQAERTFDWRKLTES